MNVICVVDTPNTDSFSIQRWSSHTLLLPNNATRGHRYRVLPKVQWVSPNRPWHSSGIHEFPSKLLFFHPVFLPIWLKSLEKLDVRIQMSDAHKSLIWGVDEHALVCIGHCLTLVDGNCLFTLIWMSCISPCVFPWTLFWQPHVLISQSNGDLPLIRRISILSHFDECI